MAKALYGHVGAAPDRRLLDEVDLTPRRRHCVLGITLGYDVGEKRQDRLLQAERILRISALE